MSEYDLLLTNILRMSEHVDNLINECSKQNAVHIATHLNDARLNLETVKGEIDKFEASFDADTRHKLINKSHWELKTDKSYLFKIREIDLRTMEILYSYNLRGTSYLRRESITKFLNDFE